jgi:hypothetical protein
MKLENLGSNKTVIYANDKTVFFSYNTPVAAIVDGIEYKTSKKWSVTTSKHINSFVSKRAEEKEQSFFDNLL